MIPHLVGTPIIALEGGVCAGKSTWSTRAEVLFGSNRVPEYMDVISDTELNKFPQLSPREIFGTFLDVEARRATQLSETQPNFVDRTVLTLLAHDLSRLPPAATESLEYLSEFGPRATKCIIPDVLLFIRVPPHVRAHRAEQRLIPPPEYMVSDNFNVRIEQCFRQFSSRIPIDFIEGDGINIGDVDKILLSALERAKRTRRDDLIDQYRELFREVRNV